jgi:drug/metabolite transporter (DMT)-like permease
MSNFTVYLFALAANLVFSTSGLGFTHYSKTITPYLLALFKVLIAFFCFAIVFAFSDLHFNLMSRPIIFLLISGTIGLCFGDLFLFKGYSTIGPARTLILFSFQPLFLGIYGYFFLNQNINFWQMLSILFMLSCLLLFANQRKGEVGHFDLRSFMFAFIGIALDAIGVILTREAFDNDPNLDGMSVNFFRCLGAVLAFLIISPRSFIKLGTIFKNLELKDKSILFSCAFFGCFVSLALYLSALKYAHVATLTAISITGPLWISMLECLYKKQWPNKTQLSALGLFILGFICMNFDVLFLV